MENDTDSEEPFDECICGFCVPCRKAMRRLEWEITGRPPRVRMPVEKTPPKPKVPRSVQTAEWRRSQAEKASGEAEWSSVDDDGNPPPKPAYRSDSGRSDTASARQQREAREKNFAQLVWRGDHWFHPSPTLVHGTSNSRKKYGCGCGECMEFGRSDYHKNGKASRQRASAAARTGESSE